MSTGAPQKYFFAQSSLNFLSYHLRLSAASGNLLPNPSASKRCEVVIGICMSAGILSLFVLNVFQHNLCRENRTQYVRMVNSERHRFSHTIKKKCAGTIHCKEILVCLYTVSLVANWTRRAQRTGRVSRLSSIVVMAKQEVRFTFS